MDAVIQGHASAERLNQEVVALAAGGPRDAVRAAEQLVALLAFAEPPWDADTQLMLQLAAQAVDEALRVDGSAPITLPEDTEGRELLADVLTESEDGLSAADELLDAEGLGRAGLDALFRVFHTLKGSAAFVRLVDVEIVAHAAEDLMAVVRDAEATLAPEVVELLCDAVRLIRQILASAAVAAQTRTPLARAPEVPPMLARLADVRAAETLRLAPGPGVAADDAVREDAPVGVAVAPRSSEAVVVEGQALKVDRERLSRMMDVVGELVILEALIAHVGEELPVVPPGVSVQLRRLRKITRDLATAALSLRAAPLASLLRKLPRRVRDAGQRLGGSARLTLEGPPAELDRELIERLEAPLLEALDAVVAAGASTAWDVVVRVEPRGSRVALTMSASTGRLGEDALNAAQRAIEALRGRMTVVRSPPEVVVEVPRTLALLDALVVRVGAESFAVASTAVLALRPLARANVATQLGRWQRVQHRGRWIPLWPLRELLSVPPAQRHEAEVLVVLEAAGQPLGVVVEEARSTQISVKTLDGPLLEGSSFVGATVLGDGTLALVLSVDDLARRAAARENSEAPDHA